MDVYGDEILELWQNLSHFEVEYIMVGGFATNMHGFSRVTDDLDMWIHDTNRNRERLGLAFDQLEIAPKEIVERMQFVPGWTNFSLVNGFKIDVMTSLKGLENLSFYDCFEIAIKVEVENISVPFLHINHLITAKKAANRPKDQLDIIELEKIKKRLEEKGKL